jgi:hypothetical protein
MYPILPLINSYKFPLKSKAFWIFLLKFSSSLILNEGFKSPLKLAPKSYSLHISGIAFLDFHLLTYFPWYILF